MRLLASAIVCISITLYTVTAKSAALPTLSPQGGAQIDRMLQAAVSARQVPGVVALVTNKERIIYLKAFGQRNVAGGVPMSTDTVFRIASMTKPITSVGIMMLYEHGSIGLDDPVGKYLPAYKGREVLDTFNPADASYTTRPAKSEMTIRRLLTQTAGLAYPFTSTTVLAIQTRTKKDPKEMPLMYEPGTKWHYSPATGVLGDIIQSVSGQSLEEWDQSRVLRPLDMRDTTYVPTPQQAAKLVTVHTREASGLVEHPNPAPYPPDIRGDGGLVSTAADYAAFIQMLLNEGTWHGRKLLEPQTVKVMTTNQIGNLTVDKMPAAMPERSAPFPINAGRDKFGFGFQIAAADGSATHERSAGSYSWGGINNTHFWVDPKHGVGAVILMQVLPFYDPTCMDVMKRFEHLIYQHLEREGG